jgi:hypothetical protein
MHTRGLLTRPTKENNVVLSSCRLVGVAMLLGKGGFMMMTEPCRQTPKDGLGNPALPTPALDQTFQYNASGQLS